MDTIPVNNNSIYSVHIKWSLAGSVSEPPTAQRNETDVFGTWRISFPITVAGPIDCVEDSRPESRTTTGYPHRPAKIQRLNSPQELLGYIQLYTDHPTGPEREISTILAISLSLLAASCRNSSLLTRRLGATAAIVAGGSFGDSIGTATALIPCENS